MATPPRSTARSTSNSPRPKELGGGGGAGNNPEQLFAAGYAACFIGAMKFVASQGGPKVPADAVGDLDGRHRTALGRRLRP